MRRAIVLALVVVITGAGVTSAVTVYDIDDEHSLDRQSSIDEYDQEGVVSATLLVPDMRITIAEDHDDAGVDGFRADFAWHFVRIEYNETLPAELRIYFPDGYWHPNPQDLEAIESDQTAELRSIRNGSYSSLTVRFDGRADVTFAVPRAASLTFATRDYSRDVVENRTDLELPRVSSNDPWSYIDQSDLAGNTTVAIERKQNRELTIQYDAGTTEERWIGVPSCSASTGSDEPVCQFTRDGGESKVYVLSRTTDPPPVRFKYDAGPVSAIQNVGKGIQITVERALSWIGGLFGTVTAA